MTERKTPRQNRVTPHGEIIAIKAHGRAMGNRGNLLNENSQLTRQWGLKRWICCTLAEVNGRKVQFDNLHGYTPLFFTDEAVALAAGHRPCGSCRPEAYYRWLTIWKDLAGIPRSERVRANTMDQDLHRRRQAKSMLWRKSIRLSEIPEGSFVSIAQVSSNPFLVWEGRVWSWERGAYSFQFAINEQSRDLHCFPFLGTKFLVSGFRFDDDLQPIPAEHTHGVCRD
jgi:hypothetical protein